METVERIAEVVLYEGFLLYPYTRTTTKNQQRWTFGGVYPRAYSESSPGDDPWLMQTQCVVLDIEPGALHVKVRFLHVMDRTVLQQTPEGPRPVEELRSGDQVYRPWEEAIEREVIISDASAPLTISELLVGSRRVSIEVPAGSDEEAILALSGERVGWLRRAWQAVQGEVDVSAEALGERCYRLTVRIVNTTPFDDTAGMRDRTAVVRRTLISTHTILHGSDGAFVSLLEPPAEYGAAVKSCENIRTWPVLVGEGGAHHTLLSSPIILYDYPQIAPESQVNFFDTTEIDELLVLSVMTLTDEEKREMRETDPRAREILDRTESLTPEELMSMHGSIRSLQSLRGSEP